MSLRILGPILFFFCLNKCFCFVSSAISQRRKENKDMQFLFDLNDQYDNVKSHVVLMELIPSITRTFSFLAQQEQQLINNVLIINVKSINHTVNYPIHVYFFFNSKQ